MLNWANLFPLTNKYLRVEAMIYDISTIDVEDIRQNVFLHILKHRSSVAELATAELKDFIDLAVAKESKRWKRYRLRFKSMEDEQMPTVNETRQGEFGEAGCVNLKLDIEEILQLLTARQIVICRHLMAGATPRRVRRIFKYSPATMTTELDEIRQWLLLFDCC